MTTQIKISPKKLKIMLEAAKFAIDRTIAKNQNSSNYHFLTLHKAELYKLEKIATSPYVEEILLSRETFESINYCLTEE